MSSSQYTSSLDSPQNTSEQLESITADPLIPRPLGMENSVVKSSPSPLTDTDQLEATLRWQRDEQSSPPLEEQTRVWSKDGEYPPIERPQAITIPLEQKTLRRTLDVESTDEWIAPKVSPLLEGDSQENDALTPQQQEVAHERDQRCLSEIEKQLYQITITTPPLKWGLIAKSAASVGVVTSLLLITEIGVYATSEPSLFGSALQLTIGSLLLIVTLILSLWCSQRQRISVNQAQVTYRRLFWLTLSRSTSFPFSELQEVSEHIPIQDEVPQPSSITLVGKDREFRFGEHLSEEEKRYLLESLKEKVVDLQQGVFR